MIYGKDIKYKGILLDEESYKKYDIDNFHCDDENVNIEEYLKYSALNDYSKNIAVTKLIINMENKDVIGFYSLSTTALAFEVSGKTNQLPSMEIKFFAIDKRYQHMKYDEDEEDVLNNLSNMIFFDILYLIRKLSEEICGVHSIILYSVPKAYNFYKRHGFKDFEEFMIRDQASYIQDCVPMYMKL
ncbi:hypothetical protein G6Z34_13070 [Clostridium perfringens]|uniref:N-acetyltransferase domain-containing protein n=1 Tax=Clostridium perfringens TaxID=1502 RepID=A0AAP6WR02_CLOPF|nr:hypothetical protein [Clostridium perfringens]NGU31016.1 hypothetical protein [Clostridium perfringens]